MASETLEEARALLRSLGERRPEAYALHRLGTVSEQVGGFADAERMQVADKMEAIFVLWKRGQEKADLSVAR